MALIWSGIYDYTQDGQWRNPDAGMSIMLAVGTYKFYIGINEGPPPPHEGYASRICLTNYPGTGNPFGRAAYIPIIFKTTAPGGGSTLYEATLTVAEFDPPSGDGTLDYSIGDFVISGGVGNGTISSGVSATHVTAGSPYYLAVSGAGDGDITQFAWEIYDDAGPAPEPPPDPGDVTDVVDDDDVFVDTVIEATDKVFRVERLGWGSGSFKIRRDSVEAPTIGTGHDGRMVKVTVPRISADPIFRWMIENVRTVVAHPDEQGEEMIAVAGRGAFAYIGRAVSSPYTYVVPSGPVEVHRGPAATGQKAGQVLRRAIAEYQHVDRPQHPIPLITVDFDYTLDSDGNAWNTTDATEEMAVGYTGENALQGIQELWGTGGIDMMLKPDGSMLLQAFNYYGRDLTATAFGAGKVRFVKGVNIADILSRTRGVELPMTHVWVEGDDLVFLDPPAELTGGSGRPIVEGFLHTIGTDPAVLEAVGESALIEALRRGESVAFNVAIVEDNSLLDEDAGLYLPGPPGTNGHFWIGDTVTIDSGDGVDDFDNEEARIEAITIWFDDANNLKCKVEVKATTILGRVGPSTGTAGSGIFAQPSAGGTGGVPPPPVPPSTVANDHITDPTDAHDASAVSYSPTGTIAATNVQSAVAEVSGDVSDHLADTVDAHDASAISIVDAGNYFTGTQVEAALQELGAGGGAAPSTADYLVGTAQGGLSAEIVVGTTPGGELGGTWSSPTVDGTHSGSSHAGVIATHEAAGDPHPGYTTAAELAAGLADYVAKADDVGISIVIDNGTSVITTGQKAAFKMPRAGHFRASPGIVAPRDATSSAVFDIWVHGGSMPLVAHSITASAKPTLTASQFNDTASAMTSWVTAFSAGDWVIINLDSVTNATLLVLYLPIDWT